MHFNADPGPSFHFNTDPDQTFHFNADLDPDPSHKDMRFYDLCSLDPPGLYFEPPAFWLLNGSGFSFTLTRIRIQLPRITRIQTRNPAYHAVKIN
jgi:hypothetical protein